MAESATHSAPMLRASCGSATSRSTGLRKEALRQCHQGRLLEPDRGLLHRLTDEVPARDRCAESRRRSSRQCGGLRFCTRSEGRNFAAGSSSARSTGTPWSGRRALSVLTATTRPWSRSSACSRRTSWTARLGPLARSCGSRSSGGSRGPATAAGGRPVLGV